MKMEKCWICRRSKKDIEKMMDEKKVIMEDITEFSDLKEEMKFDFFKKNKFKICGICRRLLSGFIDDRHKCLHKR